MTSALSAKLRGAIAAQIVHMNYVALSKAGVGNDSGPAGGAGLLGFRANRFPEKALWLDEARDFLPSRSVVWTS